MVTRDGGNMSVKNRMTPSRQTREMDSIMPMYSNGLRRERTGIRAMVRGLGGVV